eukprot:TRINITY_DN92390_c0_g1_i1.p1 TRINITY_DN92390_c0_g1~~TRINITY_DN92390_c0_g1_i1.p1  ORF type:complete len:262 (+),score=26.02 TRINITY_DN92390_c0_g1_i1:58-786(+)
MAAAVAQPPRSLTREEARLVDHKAAEMGQPTIILMENAGLGLTNSVCHELATRGAGVGAVVGIVCGRGNNAGDGYVLARHLTLRGYVPRVAYCGDRAKTAKRDQDYGINLTVIENMGVSIEDVLDGPQLAALLARWSDATLLVDAMLGTGLAGAVRDDYKAWIEALNAAPQPKVAVDIPSGLDCDTGLPLGVAVRACRTVTFVGRKVGFDTPASLEYTGQVDVVPIGCPAACWDHVAISSGL